MCGIAGYLSAEDFRSGDQMPTLLKRMGSAIRARGPDDSGEWWDSDEGIGLAHRRLAIIDLSRAGHQPYRSKCGRFVLVFNGEIYNHLRLRQLMEAEGQSHDWEGHSDTETLTAAIVAWGVVPTLQRAEGMFAFAVWDRSKQQLTLGRDRAGEKPLYYGWQGDCFLFGSELKAIRSHPAFQDVIDSDALAAFLRYSYVPEPRSIYAGIGKLIPGSIAVLSLHDRSPRVSRYWDLRERIRAPRSVVGTPDMAVGTLQDLLRRVVADQMVADVPIGAFLSGGVDSSAIVSIMQEVATAPVNTFSIGFDEVGFDEAPYARAVAKVLGTRHHELYMASEDVLGVIPSLPDIYDEPFADSSQLPTFLVSRMARSHVKVALSGDAGDELFCGYNRYRLAQKSWAAARWIPHVMRRAAGSMITAVPPHGWDMIVSPLRRKSASFALFGDKLHKIASIVGVKDPSAVYEALITGWPDTEQFVRGCLRLATISEDNADVRGANEIERMMALDFLTFLPGDILTKVDRASMANSLEVRAPFLNHHVVDFAWSLPLSLKLRDGATKWILRQVLYKYVPQSLIERPKMGFGVPIDRWLRTALRPWAEDLIYSRNFGSEDHLDMDVVKRLWSEHLSGNRNWQQRLWSILMFLSWLERRSIRMEP